MDNLIDTFINVVLLFVLIYMVLDAVDGALSI